MYWLLDYEEQDRIRETILSLHNTLALPHRRVQEDQTFPFVGRKDRGIAATIIESLSPEGGMVCDPFAGSGTFVYSALDCNRNVKANEWEPYAHEMMTAPLTELPTLSEYNEALASFISFVLPVMQRIYETTCPECNEKIMFDGIFFDRSPEEYFNPTLHERLGRNNHENVIFRGKYKCPKCGCKEKNYDDNDEAVRQGLDQIEYSFPDVPIIENSRLNFTSPDFTRYGSLFSKRQKIALSTMSSAILNLSGKSRKFFYDTFLSIIHLGKYTDYRSKSQDNHCPANRLKETNLYYRYLEKLNERWDYITRFRKENDTTKAEVSFSDFRDFLNEIESGSVDLLMTDPPFGDTAQYFEHAQRVHPFIPYSLMNDKERLAKEVVISNAPSREDKHGDEQFMRDIEELFMLGSAVIKEHGYFVLYFRPKQSSWISNLNQLKHFGRKHGLEPLMAISLEIKDPSMRALASAAWTFSKDTCFVFLKLKESERRWYEGNVDVDELVYLAASKAASDEGRPFVVSKFYGSLQTKLRSENLSRLSSTVYQRRFLDTLLRYANKDGAQYYLKGDSPYDFINREEDAELRLREFAPLVLEELGANGKGFSFEDYVLRLSTYLDNGSRTIVQRLKVVNPLISEFAERMTYKAADSGTDKEQLFLKQYIPPEEDAGKTSLYNMDPYDFERLVADYFVKRGYVKAETIGGSGDRGVDVLVTNLSGDYEFIQCKRYRKGSNIGSTPIQRVDSMRISRGAVKAWVFTTSDFTPEGIDEARITGVNLVNGAELIKSLELYYPNKYCL